MLKGLQKAGYMGVLPFRSIQKERKRSLFIWILILVIDPERGNDYTSRA